jgi:recombination protein RecA
VTKQIDSTIAAIQKELKGDRVVVRLGDRKKILIDAISSGIPSLDLILGCGGFPKGRIIEIFGGEASAKTTVTLSTIAEAQKLGGEAMYVAAEADFNPEWTANLGVNMEDLILCQPDYGEQALEIVEKFVESGASIVAVDSVEGLVPKAELEGEMGDSIMGVKARLISQACRKLAALVARSGTVMIFTNQIREKIGVTWGNPEVTPGGRALKFWSSVRLDLRSREKIKEGDKIVGATIRARVVKNKVAPAFLDTEFDVYTGSCNCHQKGVDRAGNFLDLAETKGLIEKTGSWYSVNGERLGQGRNEAAKALWENTKFAELIREKLKKGEKQ